MRELTYDEAHQLFRYDQDTGKLFWRVSLGRRVKAGDEAGTVYTHRRTQYRRVGVRGKYYCVHRIVWLMLKWTWPKLAIDHIDGNGLNNRIENLRDVPGTVNQRNRRMRRDNTSGVNGVYWHKKTGKWKAQSQDGSGSQKHIGLYDDIRAAERAVVDYQALLGFSERHGKEECG